VVPRAGKIGLLANVTDPASASKVMPQLIELKDAARALGLTAVVPEINGSEDVGGAIQALANERVDVIIVLESTMLLSLHRQIAQLMAANRRRVFYGYRDHVDEGGLIGYGVDLR
jgi:putative ABC transport system substrate-binding protein